MRSARARVVPALLAAAVAAAPAVLHAQRSAGGIHRLSAAVGGDVRGAAGGDGFGRSLLLAYDLGRVGRGLPVEARLPATAFGRAGGDAGAVRFGGAGLDLTLPLGAEGSRVRPYLLAGAGAYALRGVAPRDGAGPRDLGPTVGVAAFAGGAGVRVPVGRASVFAEARYTAFAGGGGRAPTSYVPLVIGLHF